MPDRPAPAVQARRARAEASRWFARREGETWSVEDAAALERWLDEPGHAHAFAQVEQAWAGFDAQPAPALAAIRGEALALRPARAGPFAALGVAVAGVLVVTLAVVPRSAPPPAPAPVRETVLTSGSDRPRDYRLVDGSTVTLDIGTRLRVAFTPARRLVHIDRGQAFFAVAKNPRRPFTVDAGGASVTAIGTAFDVHRDARWFSTTLVTGRISVAEPAMRAGDAAPVTLSPGHRLSIAAGGRPTVERVDLARAMAWRSGAVEFDDEPLPVVARELARYAGQPVIVDGADAARLRVSGVMSTAHPLRFATALAETMPIAIRRETDRVVIFSSPGGPK